MLMNDPGIPRMRPEAAGAKLNFLELEKGYL
jgi:hypothetical protein